MRACRLSSHFDKESNTKFFLTSQDQSTVLSLLVAIALVTASLCFPRCPQISVKSWQLEINQASLEEWEAIPRVGPTLAKRICHHRHIHGPYKDIQDISQVPGIGKKLLHDISPYLQVEKKPCIMPGSP